MLELYGNDIFAVPAYLLQMRPVLKVAGNIVVTGAPVGLGSQVELIIENIEPNKKDTVRNIITVGDYLAVVTVSSNTGENFAADKMGLLSKKISLYPGAVKVPDDLIGTFLYSAGIMYFHRLSFDEKIVAKNLQLAVLRKSGNALMAAEVETEEIFGAPVRVVNGGVSVDVDRNIFSVFPLDGNQARKKDFMIITGLGSSYWESGILEILTGTPAVSAAVLLKAAKAQGIEIYNVDRGNVESIIPVLEVADEVKQDVRNAAYAGKKVILPQKDILYNGFNGTGYLIIDPVTGGGAYMIAGGLAGAKSETNMRDPSVWRTEFTRRAIIKLAIDLDGYPYVYGAEGVPDRKCGFDCSGFIHYLYISVYGPNIWGINPDGSYIRPSRAQLMQICTAKNWWHPYEERLQADILFSNFRDGDYHHANIIDNNIDYSWTAAGGPCWWPLGEFPDLPDECRRDAAYYGYVPICKDSRVKRIRNEMNLSDPNEPYLMNGHSDQICRPVP